MKKYFIALVIMATVAIGAVFAMTERSGKGIFAYNREQMMRRVFDRVSAKLNMSDEQKTAAQAILEDSKQRVQPLMKQMMENHQAAKDLGTDGVFNQEKAQQLAEAQAEIMKQLLVEKEKTKAQLFAVLNNDQREQAKVMLDSFGNRFKNNEPPDLKENVDRVF